MSSRVPKVAVPESGVLRACLDLLAAEKIFHRRMNTGAVKTGDRFFRFGQKGDADILAMRLVERQSAEFGVVSIPQIIWIECKSDTGRQSHEQKRFQLDAEACGHHYLLVRDVDTLRDWLKTHGV